MSKCKTCGAPVNLAPDGDPKYEPPKKPRAYPLETVDQVHDWHNRPDFEWLRRAGDDHYLPIPDPVLCAENLRDDGFHPEATCVERMNARIRELQDEVARLESYIAPVDDAINSLSGVLIESGEMTDRDIKVTKEIGPKDFTVAAENVERVVKKMMSEVAMLREVNKSLVDGGLSDGAQGVSEGRGGHQ